MQPTVYSPGERLWLLALARRSVQEASRGFTTLELAETDVPSQCRAPRACFVTLTKGGQLRGCIGNIIPAEPLYRNVMSNARGAALRDSRFPPVEFSEMSELLVHISVLTIPSALNYTSAESLLALLRPAFDGVLLRMGSRQATFLPQVWNHFTNKEEFLNHLCQKAGCEPFAWRHAHPAISVYQTESFGEEEGLN